MLGGIEITVPSFSTRHATTIALAVPLCSLATAAVAVWARASHWVVAELLCYGAVGAVLIARRPDLPFGWVLGLAALADMLVVGVGIPAAAAADADLGGELAIWGVELGGL